MEIVLSLGEKLRALRVKRGDSLQDVADAIGASKAHVWELETGRSKNPSIDLLSRLAGHYEVSTALLVSEDGADDEELIKIFGREFRDLNEEDWDMLRAMAKRLKGKGPPNES